jgi:hypothetical protein
MESASSQPTRRALQSAFTRQRTPSGAREWHVRKTAESGIQEPRTAYLFVVGHAAPLKVAARDAKGR